MNAIVVAMSGGVDSSVAAALLAEQGHEVIGLSMQLYDQAERRRRRSAAAARSTICTTRGASPPPSTSRTTSSTSSGSSTSRWSPTSSASTPPDGRRCPCAHCNSDLKFATLVERARGFGADAVATGHYARVERGATTAGIALRRGVDPAKDQSYFLFSLTQAQLAARGLSRRRSAEGRGARVRARAAACRSPTSRTARRSASSPTTTTRSFVDAQRCRRPPRDGAIVDEQRPRARHATAAFTASPSASARGSACRPRTTRRADVRAGAAAGRSAGGRRPEGVARADAADRVRRELDRRTSRRRRCASTAQIRHRHQAAPAADRARSATRAPRSIFDAPQLADHARPGGRLLRRRRRRRRRLDRLESESQSSSAEFRSERSESALDPERSGSILNAARCSGMLSR